ncbi:MAG: DUF4142 domain-containing protein [Candidatus Binataceae bacterium]
MFSKWLKSAALAVSIPAALFLLLPAAFAQTGAMPPGTPNSGSPGVLPQSNQNVGALLMWIHDVNKEEIAAGKIAKSRGTTKSIKNYGKMLVEDHQQADREVKHTAHALNVKVNSSEDRAQHKQDKEQEKDLRTKLKSVKGTQFDHDFLTAEKNDHEQVIDRLKSARSAATNTQVQNLLDKLIPVMQKHEKAANALLQNPNADLRNI